MKAVRHVGVVVSDIDRALGFYRDMLGLKVVRQMEESGEYIDSILGLKDVRVTTVKLGAGSGTLIELLCYGQPVRKLAKQKDIREIGVSHVALTVDNLDAEYSRLSKAGVRFNSPPQMSPDGCAKVAFCKGPDNAFIELVQVLK